MSASGPFVSPEFPGLPGWQMVPVWDNGEGVFATAARFGDDGFEAFFTGHSAIAVVLAALEHMQAVEALYAAAPRLDAEEAPRPWPPAPVPQLPPVGLPLFDAA